MTSVEHAYYDCSVEHAYYDCSVEHAYYDCSDMCVSALL
jgi:hypothetical protein